MYFFGCVLLVPSLSSNVRSSPLGHGRATIPFPLITRTCKQLCFSGIHSLRNETQLMGTDVSFDNVTVPHGCGLAVFWWKERGCEELCGFSYSWLLELSPGPSHVASDRPRRWHLALGRERGRCVKYWPAWLRSRTWALLPECRLWPGLP